MTIEDILPQLKTLAGKFPSAAVQAAIVQKEAITPHLLAALAEAANNPKAVLGREDFTYIYAAFLLSQFREPRAFPLILKLASYDSDTVEWLMSDSITEDLHQWLASTYDGNLAALQQFIENPEHDEWVRAAGIKALAMLMAHGMLPRDVLMQYYQELLESRLERDAWVERSDVAVMATYLGPAELYEVIKQGYEEETIDRFVMGFDWVEAALQRDPQELVEEFRQKRGYTLVDDTVSEMEGWANFENKKPRSRSISNLLYAGAPAKPPEPYVAPQKAGRIDPCPCGSGKKYKKCCGA
jgi:hypothetical protein